ncbi:MAG TPA: hypothetical protein VG406_00615 [Isosphaeraceae bacterium]|jgi:hypothetical protein|nr:hypothetical protein [Isosphaeraceae bacterium]
MSSDIFGTLKISGAGQDWEIRFDRLACDGTGRLLFASVVADAGHIKGVRATLNDDSSKATIAVSGAVLVQPRQGGRTPRDSGVIARLPGGYLTDTHRLGDGRVHAFLMTKADGFLPSVSEEALWRKFKSPSFTTPLLRDWMPYAMGQLGRRKLLIDAYCHRCAAGVLTCTTADLDSIVSEGLRAGLLTI